MILDADKYRLSKDFVISLYKNKVGKEELQKLVSQIAVATGVPIVIVASYIGEEYGFSDALTSQIDRVKSFYNVKEIINVKK